LQSFFLQCEAARHIITEACGPNSSSVHAMKLDLSSQKDIKRFVSKVKEQFPNIHYLINNAGMYGTARAENTEDGLEKVMATNYFGLSRIHFYL
jgi:NAD(P)-dependent dehydrogenase (short-subunit alcohol dehydrogenase family)